MKLGRASIAAQDRRTPDEIGRLCCRLTTLNLFIYLTWVGVDIATHQKPIVVVVPSERHGTDDDGGGGGIVVVL
jgi:hypothetical protein